MQNEYSYPVIFELTDEGYLVTVPDIDIMTQGKDIGEAVDMARDAISLYILDKEEDGEVPAQPKSISFVAPEGAIVTEVKVEMQEYRRKFGTKIVKKNCSLPAWLCTEAEKRNINFSQTLQEALLAKLG